MKGLLERPQSHRSILVADHDHAVRQQVVRWLERDGFSIYEAGWGREVIDMAKKRFLDILIMEMDLPDLSGLQTLRTVNRLVGPIPCILLAAESSKEMWLNALTEHAFALMEAPFRGEVIRRTVWDLVRRTFGQPMP